MNLQPSDYKTVALPFELLERLDPAVGIEPTFTPSKGVYLPLVDTGILTFIFMAKATRFELVNLSQLPNILSI